ncbi:unnamed protein product [Hyaloperonospora brassicae]|uniref:TBC1 domain family member 23 n=1 Tax=Hyaloperonospora brassicae TaxID=162125 RepID=A0AAV0TNG8_HYABA|nr:unnamed protein product [Hyaloperonospora brassicae]
MPSSRDLELSSSADAPLASRALSTCAPETCSPASSTASASVSDVSTAATDPPTSRSECGQTTKHDDDALHTRHDDDPESAQLERQLRDEMKKRRPDHFVIRAACRSLGGVPSELRAQVWKELLGVARSERLYLDRSILQVQEDLDNQRVIAADAARTRSNEHRFQAPETVELVVKLLTYYCKCRSIQYKQGMNEVLAPFLLLTEQRKDDNDRVPLAEGVVFQCFYALIDHFLPQVFVDKEFKSLQCSFQLYRLLMLYHDPELCHYLDQHDMTPELYVTPWFMTLFARSLPPDLVFCLWDLFLLEGDPYMLHFVAYALVAANRKQIFEAEFAMLPQVLSSLTFSSRHELEQVCASARAILKLTPQSFKRDLYSVCYGGFTSAMVPFLDQIYACSSLRVYPEELVRNLRHGIRAKRKEKRTTAVSSATLATQEEVEGAQGLLDPLRSPLGDQAPLLYVSGSDGENGSAPLRFVVLDCRSADEYHKSHLILSHHVDPSVMGQPDALDALVKGFSRMKGCHFCFVGPSIDSPSFLTRSSSKNAALNSAVRLARVISNDNPQCLTVHDPIQKRADVGEQAKVAGTTTVPSTDPVTLSRKQSPAPESGALASELTSYELSKVHAEHLSVTRLVQVFLQNGFKYVSGLAGGFDELEKSIAGMDVQAQQQLLVSSLLPTLTFEKTVVPDSTGTSPAGSSFLAKMGLRRSYTISRDATNADVMNGISSRSSVDTAQLARTAKSFASPLKSSRIRDREVTGKKKKKATTAASSAAPTFSQRLTLLKAAAKDAVSSAPRSVTRTSNSSLAKAKGTGVNDLVDGCGKAADVAGVITDVEIQPGPIGISFRKSCTSKIYYAAVDSLVPGSQACATGLVHAGDLLVSINEDSMKGITFLSVIKLIIEASRPVVLRFLTPVRTDEDAIAPGPGTISPLAPTLVRATRHSIYITWDETDASLAPGKVPLYQLQFAKQSGDDCGPWVPVAIELDVTITHVDANGVTDQTNGTMVGLNPGDSLVFRVRCGSNNRWGPFSPSSSSMKTLDAGAVSERDAGSATVTPVLAGRDDLASARFHPGVCFEVAEQGASVCQEPLTTQARRHPDRSAENVDIVLDRGQPIQGFESSGSNQIFVRLASDTDGMWAFESTPQGGVVLQRLPGSSTKSVGPMLQEPTQSIAHAFLRSHAFQSTSGNIGANASTTSAAISSVVSTTVSSTSVVSAASSSRSPAPPSNLQVLPVSGSEVTLTWEMAKDVGVTKYQIQYVKDRLAAMWRTVDADIGAETVEHSVTNLQSNTLYLFRIRSGTDDKRWGPYSELSESCRTLPGIARSGNSACSHESGSTSSTRQPASSDENERQPVVRELRRASARTAGTILDKAKAAALRLKSGPSSSSSHDAEVQTNEEPSKNNDGEDVDEMQSHDEDEKSELTLPESRFVNLAKWKSSLNDAHKDFRFYHVTKFEEEGELLPRQLSRLGHRELVVTPSLLVVLNVMAATQEGFALVEEWRSLTSLAKIAEQDGLVNSLVFHFKDECQIDMPENGDSSGRLIVVVEGAKACAEVVQAYHAKCLTECK